MQKNLKIDFVSDVSCPWCAIGLAALEQALQKLDGEVQADLHFQPFELNPQMGPGGQDITEHLTQKYGSTPAQQQASRDMLRERGAALGFVFRLEGRERIYNTFDAHRLLHWAGTLGAMQQTALKKALLQAYFTEGKSPADAEVLAQAASRAGLDPVRAREVLSSGRYAAEVREREAYYHDHGINAVPSVIVNDLHLIQGGQPVEAYVQALRQVAAAAAHAA